MAIRNKKYIVRLSEEERETLTRLVRGGTGTPPGNR